MDYTRARDLMVDGQLRPTFVTDGRILDAMRRLPRERFVPADATWAAYRDGEVPLPGNRAMLRPNVIARLVQLGSPRAGERALVVGAATGYGAALLAACGVQVIALEEDAGLAALAREAAMGAEAPVRFVQGPLADGWPADAPYDLLLIEGAVRDLPPTLAAQVAPDGRMVGVLAPEGRVGTAFLAEHSTGGLRARPAFDAAAPLLASLVPPPAFVFA